MQYIWSVNDVVNHAWDNLSQIEDTQTSIGNYSYSVVAQVDNTGTPGSFCSSSSGTFNVNVVAEPNVPQLSIDVLSCNPYQVRVTVVNTQTGANYHWSNGFTGLESTITHDGPLQVRAEVYNCGVTAQLDLPRDLSALAWTFPKGCYAICADQPLGYIVGPLGVFTKWDWLENSNEVDFGSNSSIKDLHQLQPDATYQLHLNNGYCETTLGSASFYEIECNDCAIEYDIKDIKCININGINLYSVTLSCNNPYGTAVTSVLTTPGGEGHFDSSVLVLPAGYSLQTTLFYAISPFQSGLVTVNIQSHWRAEVCNSEIKIDFPVSCSELMPSCNFKYDLIKISCIETSYGAIYDIEIAIFNPYPIQATTTLSVPNGEGYLVPATMQLLPGDHTYHFSLYPLNGFHGGSVDLIFGSGFANLNCIKLRKYNFPALCSTAPRTCDFDYEFTKPRCQNIGANVFSYQIDMSAFNPTGSAATMTLMAPNGEGYFVSNNLLLPPYGSNQSFYFYPSAGFQGGLVTVTILVHFKEKTCYSEQTIEFKDCSATNSIDGKMGKAIIITANLLRIAPNPAKAATTIFYNFENKKAIKTIELTDVLGRTLKTWMPTEASGAIELDCSIYTNGQYLILMKEDQKVIETAKLITN